MLSKKEQNILRNQLFRHLDGIVTAPVSYALFQKGVTNYLLSKKKATLSELTKEFNANDGYLNVALRALCSQGWLTQEVTNGKDQVVFEVNENSETAFSHFHLYKDVVDLMTLSGKFSNRIFQVEPFLKLESLFKKYQNNFNVEISSDEKIKEIQEQILKHVEGSIVGPTLVHLGMSGMFHKYFMQTRFKPEEFHKDPEMFGRLLDILASLGWFQKINGAYEFTDKGLFFAKRASAYGVTVSYIPMLRKTSDLLFGNPKILKNVQGTDVKHVDRVMNVWVSGGALTA